MPNKAKLEFIPGTSVRLIDDPGRSGVLTDKNRQRAGITHYFVSFPDGKDWVPEYALEAIKDDSNNPFQLLHENRFGRQRDFRRNLTRIQLSGKLADMVYSMEATNTDFYAFQYKPVVSMLESPSKGLLIADEVGLGKTIEAGLIWTELRARYDARRLVIICPAMLRDKWQFEFKNRFGVHSRILDAEDMLKALRVPKEQVRDGEALIGSLQGLRPPRDWKNSEKPSNSRSELAIFLEEQGIEEPIIDLLIVDEAHYLRNPSSQTSKLGKLFRDVSEHVALLSATPVNLKSDDLYTLLNLIDSETFSSNKMFPLILSANAPLVKARSLALKRGCRPNEIYDQLKIASEHFLLAKNTRLKSMLDVAKIASHLESTDGQVQLANRIDKVNLLGNILTRTRKRDVYEKRVIRVAHSEFVTMTEQEQLLYDKVTEVVSAYAESLDINKRFLLASPQRQLASCMPAAVAHWLDSAEVDEEFIYETFGEEAPQGKESRTSVGPLTAYLTANVVTAINLQELINNDSKFSRLSHVLSSFHSEYSQEKILLFSYFRKTLTYLHKRLAELGIKSQVLVGGMKENKQSIIDNFKESDVRVLLCSEVASEGVDLQFCRFMVNYDLPWNPTKVEQRIGRIDRLGQQSEKVDIWSLGYASTIDQDIYERLFERLHIIEYSLGGLEVILSEKIGELTLSLLTRNLTDKEKQEQIEQTALAIENRKREEEDLEAQASSLIAHSGRIIDQINTARKFKKQIKSTDLLIQVSDYLQSFFTGFELQEIGRDEEEISCEIKLPNVLCGDLQNYIERNGLRGITRLTNGSKLKCIFSNRIYRQSGKAEIINQFHPLIKFINDDLVSRNEQGFPLVGIRVSKDGLNSSISPGKYAFALGQFVFSGIRSEERLRAALTSIDAEQSNIIAGDDAIQIIHKARLDGKDWENPSSGFDIRFIEEKIDACFLSIEDFYQEEKADWKFENIDRVNFQMEAASRHRDNQIRIRKQSIETLRLKNNTKMIPLQESQIKRIRERFDVKIKTLATKSKVFTSNRDVCCGLLQITE